MIMQNESQSQSPIF